MTLKPGQLFMRTQVIATPQGDRYLIAEIVLGMPERTETLVLPGWAIRGLRESLELIERNHPDLVGPGIEVIDEQNFQVPGPPKNPEMN